MPWLAPCLADFPASRKRGASFLLSAFQIVVITAVLLLSVSQASRAALVEVPRPLQWIVTNYMGKTSGLQSDPLAAVENVVAQINNDPNFTPVYEIISCSGPSATTGTLSCTVRRGTGVYDPVGAAVVGDCPQPYAVKASDYRVCASSGSAPSPSKNSGGKECCDEKVGGPIHIGTGNKFREEEDFAPATARGLRFTRFYNSQVDTSDYLDPQWGNANVGIRWTHTYFRRLGFKSNEAGSAAFAYRPDGRILTFTLQAGVWTPDVDISERLEEVSGGWVLTTLADEQEQYDASGKLVAIVARDGSSISFAYSDAGTSSSIAPGPGYLIGVTDRVGKSLSLAYTASGFLNSITLPDGSAYYYHYDASNRLIAVTHPGGAQRQYHYNESQYTGGANLPWALTGITDENGSRHSTYQYDSQGRAVSTEQWNGVNKFAVNYGSSGSSSRTVTDALGTSRTSDVSTLHGVTRRSSLSHACKHCNNGVSRASAFDANGNVRQRKDFNNNLSCSTYDLSRNLEVVRVEGLSGTACPGTSISVTRTITTEWHATWRLPLRRAEPKRITTYAYDSYGNLTSKSVQATTDTAGTQGFSASPAGSPRLWTYAHTYHSSITGLVTQTVVNGPRSDVSDITTLVYDITTGELASITNALGHVTTFSDFDANGRARRITDPNGLITDLVYDARGRLISRTTGGELTSYEYDAVGQLTKLTAPDGSFVSYLYDPAHRLTQIQDNLGYKIVYTLDALGNRLSEERFDPVGTLVDRHLREFNTLSRLIKDIGGANPATEIVQYTYDTQGNVTSVIDPFGIDTIFQFDRLNRLFREIQPAATGTAAGGNIQYAFDGLDQVTQVTDPRSKATTYTVDGLGQLAQQVSPDTGTTSKTFDAAGNVLTQTDARNVVASFTYDALDRLTSATYTPPGGSGITAVSLTYSYDAGSYGKGRLTGFTDPSGSTGYTYDQKGRLTVEARTIAGVAFTTQYSYNTAGQLTQVTYPSGRQLDTAYDAAGRVSQLSTTDSNVTQSVVSSITYHPFGAVKGFLFGNATPYTRTFDLSGRIASYTLGSLTRTVGYDASSRITAFTHNQSAYDQTFSYDNLDRITGWSGFNSTQGFTYDLTGNRKSLVIGANSYSYTVQSSSNRVTQTAGPGGSKSFGFDATGNTTSAGSLGFAYDARGRMISATTALGPVTYQLNALGQRVAKTVSGTTTRYHYDANGNLIGETTGANHRDYAWLGSIPVAILEGTSQHYLHADHLDTPRVVTNAANTIVWRWDSDPFGFFPAAEDPDGNSQLFTLNLRFPGQYFDKETGLHYNTFRDYDPQTGRYVESDPIGLLGGMNTYAYVDGDPLSFSDPLGEAKKKYSKPANPNKRPPPPHRKPGGERERNVGHPDAEEHSRKQKGPSRVRRGAGALVPFTIWELVHDFCRAFPDDPACEIVHPQGVNGGC